MIVAGGKGERAGSGAVASLPKQYRVVAGKTVLAHAINAFLNTPQITAVLPVIRAEDEALYAAIGPEDKRVLPPVIGGKTRQISVRNGLEALADLAPDFVLIHDAARPRVTQGLIHRVLDGFEHADAVLPATQVIDTIKRSSDGKTVGGTEDRTQLFAAQTPQGFRYGTILAAHRRAAAFSDSFTDDCAIAEWADIPIALVQGDPDNIKITNPADFTRAAHLLSGAIGMETRVGTGFDVHPFVPGSAVTLGGVEIAHDARLKGHSDADAGLHVLTDAILGALAEGDIGTHFPPSDEKWRGEPSKTFLGFAAQRVRARGGRILHLDLTLVCEAPKIGPHVQQMRTNIAGVCGIDIGRVSVKATTSEKLGFVGRREGLAAMGTATIEVPGEEA